MRDRTKLAPFQNQSESFTAFRDKGVYYVDKTDVIPYLIDSGHEICVFTRPRRFGKTLMLRMLQTFFEYRLDKDGKPIDNRRYFEGLKVMQAGEHVLKHLGRYPVISLSFKDVSGESYQEVIEQLRGAVYDASTPHEKILKESGCLSTGQLETLQSYLDGAASEANLRLFLKFLPQWLNMATKRKVVILLDEYDVPLQQAAIYDIHHPKSELFERTVRLIGKFISAGFKSNDNLAFGIIAGCMRIAKESIFTGMNNPGVITVVDRIPNEFWGFTPKEVEDMLAYYGLSYQMDALKNWYDGYYYSNREVYNPWSLLNAIRGLVEGYGDDAIQAYWSMTSSNDIIDDMIDNHPEYREELARLMEGGTKWVKVYKDLSYRDLNSRPDAIWSFLLFTGYLKSLSVRKDEDDLLEAEVTVPNREILTVMKSAMRNWWEKICLPSFSVQSLLTAFWKKDTETIESEFINILMSGISVFDYKEDFYHGMVMGLLSSVCLPRSNAEHGEGRPDIVAIVDKKALLLELKCVTPKMLKEANAEEDRKKIESMMTSALDEAEHQIDLKKYTDGVAIHYPAAKAIYCYALCFCRKQCKVRVIDK